MYSWQSIHEETAKRLLDFKNKQGELITLLHDMAEADLKVMNSRHPDVIDPMTFMSNFCRHPLNDKNRIKNWEYLKMKWGLKSSVPRNLDGIHTTVTSVNAWFFRGDLKEGHRKESDILNLWKISRLAIEGRWDEVDNELFQACLAIKDVGLNKLTSGLFWLAPSRFLYLNSININFLSKKGINYKKITDVDSYNSLMEQVRHKLGGDFISVSHQAYLVK